MRLEEAVSAYLQPILDNKLYPFLLPQKCELPAVAYYPVSVERLHSLIEDTGFVKQRLQFTCFAGTYGQAVETAQLIRAALQNYSGTMGGLSIGGVLLMNESANYETDTKLYSAVLELEFQFKEE
jgi:hypothetical protein